MWPLHMLWSIVCMALLVCILCQLVHSCIEPSLHGLNFSLFRNLFMETYKQVIHSMIPFHGSVHAFHKSSPFHESIPWVHSMSSFHVSISFHVPHFIYSHMLVVNISVSAWAIWVQTRQRLARYCYSSVVLFKLTTIVYHLYRIIAS